MWKKMLIIRSLCISLLFVFCIPGAAVLAKEKPKGPDLAPQARSAVLMDEDTGTVIYQKNMNQEYPPASITKVMTMLLVMDAIDSGKLKLSDQVQASEHAASMGGSQIFLKPGEVMTVNEMLKGIAMASANDASVAVAEKIAGTEKAFVQMMNDKAEELGMKHTHFMNSNGLPAKDHYSSAYDIALMSRALLKYPLITKYTGEYQDYLRKDSSNPFWLVNTNKLVRFYQGADGLKTGYTSEAKFCLTATANKKHFRVIAVVMGEPNSKTRNAEVSNMLDYAYAQYTNKILYKKGEHLGTLTISKGLKESLPIEAKQQYSILLKRGQSTKELHYKVVLNQGMKAPIQAGQQVGNIEVYHGEQKLNNYPLYSPASVNKANWWTLLKRTTKKLILFK